MQPTIIVRCDRNVAYEAPDHIMPWGTKQDNSRNPRFNEKLYRLFQDIQRPLRLLDIGCSGGGFVKDCHDDGCLVVGLEGSDYSKKAGRAEWRTIPDRLFTCDVTANFDLLMGGAQESARLLFDVVTSWEVMEHFAEKDIECVVQNVKKHLAPGGLWIMSISPEEDVINGIRLHQTVQRRPWWIEKFSSLGLIHRQEYIGYFNTQFVRGGKYGPPKSFVLVLARESSGLPRIPPTRIAGWVMDRWLGSKPQRLLKFVITGTR